MDVALDWSLLERWKISNFTSRFLETSPNMGQEPSIETCTEISQLPGSVTQHNYLYDHQQLQSLLFKLLLEANKEDKKRRVQQISPSTVVSRGFLNYLFEEFV